MEGARRIQDRVVRSASGRVGWARVSGLRRSVGRSQVLLDVPGFRIPGATRDCRRRRSRVELEAIAWRDGLKRC